MQDFDITKPPAKDTPEAGEWAWEVFSLSRAWRDDELHMPEVWRENHKLYRGNHWGSQKQRNDMTIGLFFSNVQRTVANIVSKNPVAEVIDLDGEGADQAKVATSAIAKWWLNTKQLQKLRASVLNSEIYGITWEKIVWSSRDRSPASIVCDPYAIFPYPGYYEDISSDCPALCHATAVDPKVVEKNYQIPSDVEVEVSDTYSILGGEREEAVGQSVYGSGKFTKTSDGRSISAVKTRETGGKGEKALVVEVWVRDFSTKKEDEMGRCACYPGGIRVITITNEGKLVLSDTRNPNLNFAMQPEQWEKNYLYNRFPFHKNNSYVDTTSIFGFSAAEQTAPLNKKIDELMSRLVNYAMRAMTGILIIPETAGISRKQVDNRPDLVLTPTTDAGGKGIRFVSLPNPPSALFNVLDLLISLHDRVHAIEDVDRGETPKNITAASAIVALQERNAALIQYKIDAVDAMVAHRGKCWLALNQMHGHEEQPIDVDGKQAYFTGHQWAGMDFDYIVDSASTIAKTTQQIQEQAVNLAEGGWVDQQYLLETLNVPNHGQVIERMAEDRLGQAMQILIQAGLPEEHAMQLAQMLQEPQGGQNAEATAGTQPPQPGTPVAYQGEMPEEPVQ